MAEETKTSKPNRALVRKAVKPWAIRKKRQQEDIQAAAEGLARREQLLKTLLQLNENEFLSQVARLHAMGHSDVAREAERQWRRRLRFGSGSSS